MIRKLTDSLKAEQDWLVDYWSRARSPGHPPPRSAINPGEVRAVLAGLSIVEAGPSGFRFRLAGSHLRDVFGREMRGEAVPDTMEHGADEGPWSLALSGVVATGQCRRGIAFDRRGPVHAWMRLPLLCDMTGETLVLCLDRYPTAQAHPENISCAA